MMGNPQEWKPSLRDSVGMETKIAGSGGDRKKIVQNHCGCNDTFQCSAAVAAPLAADKIPSAISFNRQCPYHNKVEHHL